MQSYPHDWRRLHHSGLCALSRAERRKTRRGLILAGLGLLIYIAAVCVAGGPW